MNLRRAASVLALPLSIVPIFVVVPQVKQSQEQFDRAHNSGALSAPALRLTPAQLARFAAVAPYSGAVPVLAYHGIGTPTTDDPHTITQQAFAEQVAVLRHMGFEAISMEQYVRFQRGDSAGMPQRPILITFDDARLDSYRGADEVLARYGMRATMFVVAGKVDDAEPSFLTWKELRGMADSRRWDIQAHAYDVHDDVVVDAAGHTGAPYANLRYTRSAGQETFADFEKRVTLDVFAVKDAMAQHGFDVQAFSVPSGDDGHLASNDERIAPFMDDLLHRQFAVAFVDDPHNAPGYSTPGQTPERYEVSSATTTDRLFMWLRDNAPTPAPAPAAAAPKPKPEPKAKAKHAPRHDHHRHHSRKG